jgi:hypothetical protein
MWDFVFGVIAGSIIGFIAGCILMIYAYKSDELAPWDNER